MQRVPAARSLLTGVIETFDQNWIDGWIAVRPGSPAVAVHLRVNHTDVVSTWAADPVGRAVRGAEPRRVRFGVLSIWDYVGKDDRLRIVVDGTELPIAGHGTSLRPRRNGPHQLGDLVAKLDAGYVFNRLGRLQLSLALDHDWQRVTLQQCDRVRAFVKERFDVDAFFVYGTLLGAVRENGPIGHDSDLDLAYVSQHRTAAEAADELQTIAHALIDAGFRVIAYRHHLRIANEIDGHDDVHVDLFHTFFDETAILRFPYGVAGVVDVRESDWEGVRETAFASGKGLIPVCAERMAEALYGPGWRQPQPGFNWDRDRRTAAKDAWMAPETVHDIHWADHYSHAESQDPSPFHNWVAARDDVPSTVCDLGCGDGRDSVAHASAGRLVLGFDRSRVGIGRAEQRAAAEKVGSRTRFRVGDLADGPAVASLIREAHEASGGEPVLFYARFVLHALTNAAAEALLSTLAAEARPGDLLAVEFRAEPDRGLPKTYRNHFRRYVDGAALAAELVSRYGFDVLTELESTGLSTFGTEDPVLGRVVARRRVDAS